MAGFRRSLGWAMALGVGVAVAAGGSLAKIDAAKTVADRQAAYKQLGGAFKAINDQLKAETPDMAIIKASAQKMADLGGKAGTWFPKGTGPSKKYKTAALPEIWKDSVGFAAAAAKLKAETAKLAAAADSGDIAAIKAQIPPTGGACKGCHDKFRAKPA